MKKNFYAVKEFAVAFLRDDPAGTAARTAFYFQLALLPFLLLFFSFLQMGDAVWVLLPAGVADLLREPIEDAPSALGVSLVSLGTVLFTASSALYALTRGVRKALGVLEPNMVMGRLRAAGLLGLLVLLPLAGSIIPLLHLGNASLIFGEFAMLFVFLCLLYGSSCARRKHSQNKWALASASALAAVGWMLLTRGFDLYLQLFYRQNVVYGSIGAFMALGLWLYTVCFVILLGAALYRCFSDGNGV
jgi:membrane protein